MQYHLEDLEVGQRFTSPPYAVTAEAIIAFARQFDPQPFHTDPAAARDSFFGELVASGWHTAAITMRLLTDGALPLAGGAIGAGGEIRWPAPTRPGDALDRRERDRGDHALALAPRPRHGPGPHRDAQPEGRGGSGAGHEGPRLPTAAAIMKIR